MNTTQISIQKKQSYDEYMEVRNSGIHNNGVFAKKDIPKGTRIAEYIGRKISKEESTKIQTKMQEEYENNPDKCASTYIFEIDETSDLDGDIENNDPKYINHSCNPNCEVDIIDGRVWIDTIKDIKKGEELSFNYGFEIDKDNPYEFKKQPCMCGSENCMKYILAEEEWPKAKELLEKENHKVLK